jgi:hypothetical protein
VIVVCGYAPAPVSWNGSQLADQPRNSGSQSSASSHETATGDGGVPASVSVDCAFPSSASCSAVSSAFASTPVSAQASAVSSTHASRSSPVSSSPWGRPAGALTAVIAATSICLPPAVNDFSNSPLRRHTSRPSGS